MPTLLDFQIRPGKDNQFPVEVFKRDIGRNIKKRAISWYYVYASHREPGNWKSCPGPGSYSNHPQAIYKLQTALAGFEKLTGHVKRLLSCGLEWRGYPSVVSSKYFTSSSKLLLCFSAEFLIRF
jgi:hypothetical protein